MKEKWERGKCGAERKKWETMKRQELLFEHLYAWTCELRLSTACGLLNNN